MGHSSLIPVLDNKCRGEKEIRKRGVGVLGTGLGRVSFFKGWAREGLAEKLTAEQRPGGSKDRAMPLFGRAIQWSRHPLQRP